MRSSSLLVIAVALVLTANAPADAGKSRAGKGSIQGVVTFKGTPPPAPAVDRSADPVCAKAAPPRAPVATDRKGGLRDVYVRIKNGTMGEHAAPAAPVVINQDGCAYLPRVVGVVEGGRLEVRNGDPTFHNVRGNRGEDVAFNLAQNKGAKPIVRDDLGDAGAVLSLHCDVHPWMEAWALVSDHPWFAVTGDDGRFTLSGLAPGTYELEAWHPQLGWKSTKVKVPKGKKAAKVTIELR